MEKKNLINFEGYSVEKFSMKKNPNISDEQKNTIDVKYDTYINKDKKLNHLYRSEFKIKLYTELSELYIEFDGFFKISEALKEEEKQYFLNVTAATILYPYIRTFISNVTAFDKGETVILPIINFADRDWLLLNIG